MTSTKLTCKYKLILIDITYTQKPAKDIGVVEGTWKEIVEFANEQTELHEYSTWTIKESKARKNVRKL